MKPSSAFIGEVVRYRFPTIDGKITLIALTPGPNSCQLNRTDCEPAAEIRETERLYLELWDHAHPVVRPVSVSAASPGSVAARLRLVG